MLRSRKNLLALAVSSLATAAVASLSGYSHAENILALEEIIVTARKKEESLQSTPIAVSAATRATIEQASLGDSRAIVQFAPNVVFDEIPTGTVGGGGISIRGVSYQDVEKTFDPTVIIYVDGVPGGTGTANVMSLLDIERIEVLRGPQGTLFGKNAIGGVVNIHRIKPKTDNLAGKVRVGYEDFDAPSVEGVLNVPLSDTFAAKINAAYIEKPAYFEAAQPGVSDSGGSEEDRFGLHLLWQANDDLTAEFQYNYTDSEGINTPTLGTSDENSTFALFGALAVGEGTVSGDRTTFNGDVDGDFTLEASGYQLNVDWALTDSLSLVAIAAHNEHEESLIVDTDDLPGNLFTFTRDAEYEQDSLELRLDINTDKFNATIGGFYWDAAVPFWRSDVIANGLFGGFLPGSPPFTDIGPEEIFGPADPTYCTRVQQCSEGTANYDAESYSVFFEGEYSVTDQLHLIAGARYIDEDKRLEKTDVSPIFGGAVNVPLAEGKRNDSDTIYRLGARYEFSDQTMGYVTYSTGFRSGGFSIRSADVDDFLEGYAPETLKNFEFGVKSDLFDSRLRLNATAFFMKYEDMQQELQIARPIVGTQSSVVNAADASLNGIELEMVGLISESLSVDFNLGYLDASYDEFIGQIFEDDVEGADNSNLDLRRAPELNFTLGLNANVSLGEGELGSRISYRWTDSYFGSLTNFPTTEIDSHGELDASISYSIDNWRVSLYGRNLTDEDEFNHSFVVAPTTTGGSLWSFASPRKPRHFGAEVTYTFGDY